MSQKGRVKRTNQTLQDRLVKETSLRAISDLETANAFLPAFITAYNARFAVPPYSATMPTPGAAPPQGTHLILCLRPPRPAPSRPLTG
jgi:hypothetical protein